MTKSVTINGLETELSEAPEGALITDIVIIRRYVYPENNSDAIMIAASPNTSGVTATGMINIAQRQDMDMWFEGDGDD